jgi:hypothetical protein
MPMQMPERKLADGSARIILSIPRELITIIITRRPMPETGDEIDQ